MVEEPISRGGWSGVDTKNRTRIVIKQRVGRHEAVLSFAIKDMSASALCSWQAPVLLITASVTRDTRAYYEHEIPERRS